MATKEQLQAENERLRAEVAALRALLAAVRDAADVPMYADPKDRMKWFATGMRRADFIAVYADPDQRSGDPVTPGMLHDRADSLRKIAAEPLRYAPEEAGPAPEPSGVQSPHPVVRVADEAETCGFRYLDADSTARSCQRRPGGRNHTIHWQYDGDGHVAHESGLPVIPAADAGPAPEPPADAPVASMVGRIVVDAHDDSPCPVTGRVVGQFDEDTVEVLWGERQFAKYPGPGKHEPIDSLRAAPQAASQ
jgi:hypothetical protein